MACLLGVVCVLASCLQPLLGKPSEYQLAAGQRSACEELRDQAVARQQGQAPSCTEDGSFRPLQCSGQECWCVDAEGQEVVGTRTNNSTLNCLTPCQLQDVLICSASGQFEEVQCSSSGEQCWCVDRRGMELYGTRQRGRPGRCPGSCEVEVRRHLHGAASSPPQCSDDGGFLPVQCRFINQTDGRELDLLRAFNSFPESFETFKAFRKSFPLVSSYCYCSDSRGRELEDTGVELLLSNVYDSFSGPPSGPTFSQSTIYRVLQRRLLGLRLALVGHFRCPSACEEERRTALASSSLVVPSCDGGGAFMAEQCVRGGQCWCVDPAGRGLPGGPQSCGTDGPSDCRSARRQALSHLFSDPPGRAPRSASCPPLARQLRGLLPTGARPSLLVDVLQGLFPSAGWALEALSASGPHRLQEHLFGGRFLSAAAEFNFSMVVGERGAMSAAFRDAAASISGQRRNKEWVQSVVVALKDTAFLAGLRHMLGAANGSASLRKVLAPLLVRCSDQDNAAAIFVPSCTPSGAFREVQCDGTACWCVDPLGQEEAGSRSVGQRPQCPSRCQREQAAALRVKSEMAAGADVHIPACSESGDFLPLQCTGSRCFCVDGEGRTLRPATPGGAITCPGRSPPPRAQWTGGCSQALAKVAAFRQEVEGLVSVSNSSHLPLGYGFQLAHGVRLTPEELRLGQLHEVLRVSDTLLGRSESTLRLAAFSTVQMLLPPGNHSYPPYSPQCSAPGGWVDTQCHYSTGQCWCVDEDGEFIPESLTGRSLHLPKCLTRCQRAQAHTLLSGWTKGSDITSSSYRPKCEKDGSFSLLQVSGTKGWCVNPWSGETLQGATQGPDGQLRCPSWCELHGSQCRRDGSFIPLQCDVTSCWCVSDDGQEVGGTRTPRASGRAPSCDRPLCPSAAITHGALVCRPASDGLQNCDLICHHGYKNALPVSSFQCETTSRRWEGDARPPPGACQIPQPPQSVSTSQTWLLSSACPQILSVETLLLSKMKSEGLCSAQLPSSGPWVALCDPSSLHLSCEEDALRATFRWGVSLPHLPTSDLPHLQDVALFLNASHRLRVVQRVLENINLMSPPKLVSMTETSSGCSRGYRLDDGVCVICPAGTFSKAGACPLCPQGTYQDQEGQDSCRKCLTGSSVGGASSVTQCVTECQRRGSRCSDQGNFLPAQPDFLSGKWRCVAGEGAELEWTVSSAPLTDEECSVLRRFQAVPRSELLLGAGDAEVLRTITSDLQTCIQACAAEPSCQHVALSRGQCELYSTHTHNTRCNTSQMTKGFLGNPLTEAYEWLNCSMRVRGAASDLQVIRKNGAEFSSVSTFVRTPMKKVLSGVFRTLAFSSARTSLTDAHYFCRDGCHDDACCTGFILNQNSLNGGSLLCGWLRAPSVLQCGERDWDVIGQAAASRSCGVGLTYNEQRRSFLLDLGGQTFNITDAALASGDHSGKDYQASIVSFQAVYLEKESSAASDSPSCAAAKLRPQVDPSVQQRFTPLLEQDVVVDPDRKPSPSLSWWLSSRDFDSQQALLWCLSRCEEEPLCSVADVRPSPGPTASLAPQPGQGGFFSCVLSPNSQLCGSYHSPLRGACRPLLDWRPNNTYSKRVDLSGPVKSFYQRVSFDKMVSYSVRNRVSLGENTALTDGFRECERRCDEDPCCRGVGFVQDTNTSGDSELVCLSLLSLGIQTCGDEQTSWRTQDCRPSAVRTSPHPFGWYQKPANQWTSSPGLCPPFHLPPPTNNVTAARWRLLPSAALLVDPSLTTYDVIHISRDIATDAARTRDWCIHACEEAESCMVVAVSQVDSATRCVLYPDTAICGLDGALACRVVVRETAPQVFYRTDPSVPAASVVIPGRGTLQGVTVETALGSDRKTVVQFLGVPYARPPIGSFRFTAAQPPDWSGTWDASRPRPGCVQPGDLQSDGSSEDCLYLNIFIPEAKTGLLPVLVFFFNPSANQDAGLLDGSALSAVGNIIVVTASYRTAALGFLSTGSPGLQGNYGLSDQEAALAWVHAHISLMGGDNTRVTVGAERGGADVASLRLSSPTPPLFQRLLLMGGSLFTPSLLQAPPSSRRLALDLAQELGCGTSDHDRMAACLREAPLASLNAAQTKLLASSGPFRSWSPHHVPASRLHRVDLLLGTSQDDGLISRARRIKDFEALQGRVDGKTAFYQALSRSLGGEQGSRVLKEVASWFYTLDHSPTTAGYNIFSRALDAAVRDQFIICPILKMASHWAKNNANAFLYHLPESSSRADVLTPLDVQFAFGFPHRPKNSQRFTPAERRLSLAMMSYISSFVRTGNPNPSMKWAESAQPHWQPVLSSEAPPTYLELGPAPKLRHDLRQRACSFWNQLGPKLTASSGVPGEEPDEPALTLDLPLASPSSQSQSPKEGYS